MYKLVLNTNVKTNRTVILYHGWTGDVENVKELAFEIMDKQKVNVICPRLTGHNGTADDFVAATAKDWIRDAKRTYEEAIKEGHDIVGIGGLSMGALLATIVADEFGIRTIILASPAFYNRDKMIFFTPFVSLFIKKIKLRKPNEFMENSHFTDKDYVKNQTEVYNRYIWIKPGAELLKIQRIARRKYKEIFGNAVVAIYSLEDEAVGNRSWEFMKTANRTLDLRVAVLKTGNHELFNDFRVSDTACEEVNKRLKQL
jgi:esterase/lipase